MIYKKIDDSVVVDLIEDGRTSELYFKVDGGWTKFNLFPWSFRTGFGFGDRVGVPFYDTEFYIRVPKRYYLCGEQLEKGKTCLALNIATGELSFQDYCSENLYKKTFTEEDIYQLPSWCLYLDWVLAEEETYPNFL